ncbi:hypothetical protein [Thiomicrospira microaerophila]|uniref:hypothetical protein n=1 Tax=Thiomicrospira microaerophila TaxID=406020 RepID=UPI0005CA390F|nr:hypothetical protein [Thiomicrospira microaerophila]
MTNTEQNHNDEANIFIENPFIISNPDEHKLDGDASVLRQTMLATIAHILNKNLITQEDLSNLVKFSAIYKNLA